MRPLVQRRSSTRGDGNWLGIELADNKIHLAGILSGDCIVDFIGIGIGTRSELCARVFGADGRETRQMRKSRGRNGSRKPDR